MIIVYAPAGGEPEQHDARTLRVSEASIVQRTIDRPFAAVQQGLMEDDLECLRAVVWVLKKRSTPSLRYGEFDPGIEELYTRLDKDEVKSSIDSALAVAAQNASTTAEEIRAALATLPLIAADREHAERLIDEMVADPKDEPDADPAESSDDPTETRTSGPSEPSTSDSSLTSSTSLPVVSTS